MSNLVSSYKKNKLVVILKRIMDTMYQDCYKDSVLIRCSHYHIKVSELSKMIHMNKEQLDKVIIYLINSRNSNPSYYCRESIIFNPKYDNKIFIFSTIHEVNVCPIIMKDKDIFNNILSDVIIDINDKCLRTEFNFAPDLSIFKGRKRCLI